MDKVKAILGKLKKYHFWLLSLFVFILAVSGIYAASGKLQLEFAQYRRKIDEEFKAVDGIIGQENHPNEKFAQGVNEEIKKLRTDVEKAWNNIYNFQKEKVLRWPKQLGAEYVETLEKLSPIAPIPPEIRRAYQNYIKQEFDRLPKIVDARSYKIKDDPSVAPDVRDRGPGSRGISKGSESTIYKVKWDANNQQSIDQKLNMPNTPTDAEVRICQEDLWVYDSVLRVIAAVNEKATGDHDAKIKKIGRLEIGREAAELFAAEASGVAGAATAAPPITPPLPGTAAGAAPAGVAGAEGAEGAAAANPLYDKRYVDEQGKPLPAGGTEGAVFKRMPVYLVVSIEQKSIPEFLAKLAGAALPVETRELRINSQTRKSSISSSSSPFQSTIGGARDSTTVEKTAVTDAQLRELFDVVLELHGVIYIYNPPDPAMLTSSSAADQASGEGTGGLPATQNTPVDAGTPAASGSTTPTQPAGTEGKSSESGTKGAEGSP